MIVAELMTLNPVTISPMDKLDMAYEKMKTGGFRQLPVIDKGKLIGILTDRDLREHLQRLSRTTVDAVMAALPLTACPGTPVEQAAHLLVTNKISSLPVVDNGKLVGIITAGDMLHALEAILGSTGDGSVRIDLETAGAGEISAAISLVRAVSPVFCLGAYSRPAVAGQVLYMRVAASGAERAAGELERYGFKVLAVHRGSDARGDVDP